MNKAIFIDKDGTLVPDIPYNVDPKKIILTSNTVGGLQRLKKEGYLLIVISNQSGVERGYFKEEALVNVEAKLQVLLAGYNLRLDGFYYCPHYAVKCDCRKPLPGMILKAAQEHNIDLNSSWMVGDILNDVEAGNRAGCKSILIDNGNETEWIGDDFRTPTMTCKSINEAADYILQKQLA
ncbi:D-glycero-alpha-D-manno-heptose-1,7-bisphosphate 7-phosphatase [Mucilaginibacter sp. HD30]